MHVFLITAYQLRYWNVTNYSLPIVSLKYMFRLSQYTSCVTQMCTQLQPTISVIQMRDYYSLPIVTIT